MITICACNRESDFALEDNSLIPIYEYGEIIGYHNISSFRKATSVEIQSFIENGWMSEVESRAINCEWEDGHGGSLKCDGECHAVVFENTDGTTSVGIGCFEDDVIQFAGLFR